MKKVILSLVVLLLAMFVASCGGKPEQPKVLEDSEHTIVTHGQFQLIGADGAYVANGWNGKDNDVYKLSALKATSIAAVKEIDATVGAALEAKEVKYLYVIDVVMGANDAGWTTNCMINGKLMQGNGSFAIKVAICSYDEADQVYAEDQWVPDPHTAQAESLTPATLFMPPWLEAADEFGFSWSNNPVCIGGAGVYTLVFAQYKEGYGLALVKKQAITEGAQEYSEVVAFNPADHTFGVVGSFAGSNWGEGADVAMEAGANGAYVAEVELQANDELKVRADSDWSLNWGNGGENFVVEEAGTYVVTIFDFTADGGATVTVVKK